MVDSHAQQAWIALPSDQEADEGRGKGGPYDFGFALGMSKVIMSHPRIARVWGPLYQEIMFAPEGVLTREERETVAAVAASAQDCYY